MALIGIDGPIAAGQGYTLTPGEEIRPESITAEWDGTAAAGAFKACVSIFSPAGQLISRTFPDQTFAVGDTGEVTYSPFLRQGSGAAAAAAADAYPMWEDLAILNPGDDGWTSNWAVLGTVDALSLHNGYLAANGTQNAYIAMRTMLGPQGGVQEFVFLIHTNSDHGQLSGFLASIPEDDPGSGAADPTNILTDISALSFVRVFKIEGYSAALARNVQLEAGCAREGIDNMFNSAPFRVMGAVGDTFTTVTAEPVTGLRVIDGGPGPYALLLKMENKNVGSTSYKFRIQALHRKRVDWAFG